jgi:hypothetical protein
MEQEMDESKVNLHFEELVDMGDSDPFRLFSNVINMNDVVDKLKHELPKNGHIW